MTFHIQNLTSADFDSYLDFVRKIYPQRSHVAERFAIQVLDNPFLEDATRPEILLARHEDGQIIGQFGLNPYPFHFAGQVRTGHSGFDFYVLAEHRKLGAGKKLAAAAVAQQPYLGIGATPVAESIYLKLGATTIGHLYRYFWLRSPWQMLYLAGERLLGSRWPRNPRQVGDFALPERVTVDGVSFQLRTRAQGGEDVTWSPQVLSFVRTPQFLDWRYFQHPQHYRFYARTDEPAAFFVLRRYAWRGLSLLCMVDYRTPPHDAASADRMLEAAKKLARMGSFDGVVVYSSLRFFDERLSGRGFRRIGQPTIVVMKDDLMPDAASIARRECLLATLADCDQDFAVYD